jgi:hypothetical protein
MPEKQPKSPLDQKQERPPSAIGMALDRILDKERNYTANHGKPMSPIVEAFNSIYIDQIKKEARVKDIVKAYQAKLKEELAINADKHSDTYSENMALEYLFASVLTDEEKNNFQSAREREYERQKTGQGEGTKVLSQPAVEVALRWVLESLPGEEPTHEGVEVKSPQIPEEQQEEDEEVAPEIIEPTVEIPPEPEKKEEQKPLNTWEALQQAEEERRKRNTEEPIDEEKWERFKERAEQTEATPKEWKDKLKGLVGKVYEGAKERMTKEYLADRSVALGRSVKQFGSDVVGDFKVAGKGIAHAVANPIETLKNVKSGVEKAKNYGNYFADRNVLLSERSEKLKVDLKKVIEGYNHLPFRQKMYITGGLILGGAAASFYGLPTLASIFAGSMYGMRALGGAGFALNRRKGMDKKLAADEDAKYFGVKLKGKSEAFKNTYAGVLGVAYTGGTAIAGHYAMEKLAGWIGHAPGHHATPAPNHAPVQSHVNSAPHANVPSQEDVAPAMPNAVSDTAPHLAPEVPAAPEMPHISVNATPGRGYEDMAERLWKQLHEQHLDPSHYAENSDIHKLLTADAKTINGVVHNIAKEHGFFNANGTSVQINLHDHMTIDGNGNLNLSVGNDHFIHAPVDAPTTPAYHPEVHVVPHQAEAPATHPEPPISHPTETAPVETKTMPVAPEHPSYVEETKTTPMAPENPIVIENHPAAEPPATNHPDWSTAHQGEYHETVNSIVNHYGLEVPTSEPHLYADSAKHIFVFGGSSEEQAKTIGDYFADPAHANNIIYGTDSQGVYRIPWHVVEGKIFPGAPVRTSGFLGFFSSFMKAPGPDELKQLIK